MPEDLVLVVVGVQDRESPGRIVIGPPAPNAYEQGCCQIGSGEKVEEISEEPLDPAEEEFGKYIIKGAERPSWPLKQL